MRDIFFATLSRVIVIGAQLAFVKLYSNYLSNHELGLYFFLMTASYSANAFLFVPIDYYQQAKIYQFVKNNVSLKTLVFFNRKCVGLTAVGMLILAAALSTFRTDYALNTLLGGTLSIVLYVGNAMKGALNNLEHRAFVAAIMAGEAVLKVALLYVAVMLLPRQATTLLASTITALAVSLIPMLVVARRLPVFTMGAVESIKPREVFEFAYPVSVGAVINWIQLQGYRMVLVPAGLAEMVGIYATVSGVGSAGMSAASVIFGQVYMPRIYKTSGEYTKTYLRNAALLIIVILLGSAIFSEFIVALTTKEEFKKFSSLILYGVAAEAGNFFIGALSVHLTIMNQTKKMLLASTIGLVSMAASFSVIYVLKLTSVYTIGVPIIFSQLVVVIYLYLVHLGTRLTLNRSIHAQTGS